MSLWYVQPSLYNIHTSNISVYPVMFVCYVPWIIWLYYMFMSFNTNLVISYTTWKHIIYPAFLWCIAKDVHVTAWSIPSALWAVHGGAARYRNSDTLISAHLSSSIILKCSHERNFPQRHRSAARVNKGICSNSSFTFTHAHSSLLIAGQNTGIIFRARASRESRLHYVIYNHASGK